MDKWSQISSTYRGQWIALEDDEQTVIASGKDLESTLAASAVKGRRDPIVFRVPDEIVDFVGYENSTQTS